MHTEVFFKIRVIKLISEIDGHQWFYFRRESMLMAPTLFDYDDTRHVRTCKYSLNMNRSEYVQYIII